MRNYIENRTPPSRAAPRQERRKSEREQRQAMKITAYSSNIQVN